MYPCSSSHQQTSVPCFSQVLNVRRLASDLLLYAFTHTLSESLHPRKTNSSHKPSTISTGLLHTLLRFHTPPIQQVVFLRSYSLRMGSLILRSVSHLDAFSGYLLRSSLPSYATGVTTGTQSLRPSRSSRTRDRSPQTPYAHSG